MNILVTALEQSLIMLPLILGMYISYRILKITDLTVDGTYVLGAAVFAPFIWVISCINICRNSRRNYRQYS